MSYHIYIFLKTMHPVGRLDADTSGLFLFSSDLIHRLHIPACVDLDMEELDHNVCKILLPFRELSFSATSTALF